MRDRDQRLRGPCLECGACNEYCVQEKTTRCADCNCLVTRHQQLDAPAANANNASPHLRAGTPFGVSPFAGAGNMGPELGGFPFAYGNAARGMAGRSAYQVALQNYDPLAGFKMPKSIPSTIFHNPDMPAEQYPTGSIMELDNDEEESKKKEASPPKSKKSGTIQEPQKHVSVAGSSQQDAKLLAATLPVSVTAPTIVAAAAIAATPISSMAAHPALSEKAKHTAAKKLVDDDEDDELFKKLKGSSSLRLSLSGGKKGLLDGLENPSPKASSSASPASVASAFDASKKTAAPAVTAAQKSGAPASGFAAVASPSTPASSTVTKRQSVSAQVNQKQSPAASGGSETTKMKRASASDLNSIMNRASEDLQGITSIMHDKAKLYFTGSHALWVGILAAFALGGADITSAYTYMFSYFVYPVPQDFNYGDTKNYFSYASFMFLVACAYGLMGYASSVNEEKKALSLSLLLVNGLVAVNYLAMGLEMVPAAGLDRGTFGHPFDVLRFAEWVFTCPFLIMLISQLTRTKKDVWQTIRSDLYVISLGFASSTIGGIVGFACLCGAFRYFYDVVTGLWGFYTDAIRLGDAINKEKGRSGAVDVDSLRVLRIQTCATWSMFPAIYLGAYLGLLDYETTVAAYCVADVAAKLVFTLVLVNSNLEQSQNFKVEAIEEIKESLENEVKKADDLLTNMLPEFVVKRLQAGKRVDAEEYACVTVFFSDVVNYHDIAAVVPTKQLIQCLNRLWVEYDRLSIGSGVHKIETVGEVFMGVAGCPDRDADHAFQATCYALAIIEAVKNFDMGDETIHEKFQTRVGLNSGPITAGILGEGNLHFSIVGDAVNVASRMESSSEVWKVHITDKTYELIKNDFICEELPIMEIKGKGKMKTYYVTSKKQKD